MAVQAEMGAKRPVSNIAISPSALQLGKNVFSSLVETSKK